MAGCACISQEEYDETYGHNLGPDCIPDSGDEPDDRCPPGRFFDQDICQCASLIQCFNICAPPFSIKDPVNGCECISQLEYDERYSHNLGPDCIADSGDEPIIAIAELGNTRYGVSGTVRFEELPNGKTKVTAFIDGLYAGKKFELNIHEYGDTRRGCYRTGSEYDLVADLKYIEGAGKYATA